MDGCYCYELVYAATIAHMVGENNEKEIVVFSIACITGSIA